MLESADSNNNSISANSISLTSVKDILPISDDVSFIKTHQRNDVIVV